VLSPVSRSLPPIVSVARSRSVSLASLRAAAALAKRLRWMQMAVVAEMEEVAREFGEVAKEDDICVVSQIVTGFKR
jgi:hypothetical protein